MDFKTTLYEKLPTPIAEKVFAERYKLVDEYRLNGMISKDSTKKILGTPPVIPSSPDMDARLEGMEARSEYFENIRIIEKLIRDYAFSH